MALLCLEETTMTTANLPLSSILPAEFEQLDYVKKLRASLVRKVRREMSATDAVPMDLINCTKRLRCNSGLCPICVRLMRRKLIKFCHDQSLGDLPWVALTVRAPQWVISAGDYGSLLPERPIGPLAILGAPEIKNTIATLRRRHHASNAADHSPFVCVGSVESSIKTVANLSQPKAFHVHLMVSGLTEEAVNDVAEQYFRKYRTPTLANPYYTEAVGPGWENFTAAMTYAYKQPYIKKSFINIRSIKAEPQKPKPSELLEMASNLGFHRCTDRLLLVGLKYENEMFKLTPNVISPLDRYTRMLGQR
jgi:hypothetical protein